MAPTSSQVIQLSLKSLLIRDVSTRQKPSPFLAPDASFCFIAQLVTELAHSYPQLSDHSKHYEKYEAKRKLRFELILLLDYCY